MLVVGSYNSRPGPTLQKTRSSGKESVFLFTYTRKTTHQALIDFCGVQLSAVLDWGGLGFTLYWLI
jgi:hypothetical protein